MGNEERRADTTRREVMILQQITECNIPGIGKICAAIETKDHLYIIMADACTGGHLCSKMLENGEPFTEARTAFVAQSLAATLVGLHSLNIVHRDLKLENVLFKTKDESSDVMLIDFGLSNTLNCANAQLKSCVGTCLFMAPEIYKITERTDEKRGYSEKVDMWGLGVVMFTMLSNRLPFWAETREQLRQQVAKGAVFEPNRSVSSCPPLLSYTSQPIIQAANTAYASRPRLSTRSWY
jgi:serine/threonine protein kinase